MFSVLVLFSVSFALAQSPELTGIINQTRSMFDLSPTSNILESISFGQVFSAALVIVFVIIITRIVGFFLSYLAERNAKNRLLLKNTIPIFNFLIYLSALFVILSSVFRISGSALVAGIGVLILSIGFGAKEIIANLLSGILLLGTKSYGVGDKISINGHYGEVRSIGLFDTKIQTLDDTQVSIPNSLVQVKELSNSTIGSLSMLVTSEFFIKQDNDHELVRRVLWQAAITSKYCDFHRPVEIVVLDTPFATKYIVKAYVFDQRKENAFRTDIVLRVKQTFKSRGVEYPLFYQAFRS